VRLVDGDRADGARGVESRDEVAAGRRRELLGRHIDQVELAAGGPRLGRGVGLRGAEVDGPHPSRARRSDLVMHERDEWRHDDYGAASQQREKLEANALAAAGRRHHEAVARLERAADGEALRRAEHTVAPVLAEQRRRTGLPIARMRSRRRVAHEQRLVSGVRHA